METEFSKMNYTMQCSHEASYSYLFTALRIRLVHFGFSTKTVTLCSEALKKCRKIASSTHQSQAEIARDFFTINFGKSI